jgi:polyferredoxin
MSGQTGYKNIRRLRIVSQAFFLVLFFWLIAEATFDGRLPDHKDKDAAAVALQRSDAPVKLFFQLDPLPATITLLSRGVIFEGLIIAVFVIGFTMVFGRFFCGWLCPLGTINQLAGNLARSPASKEHKSELRELNRPTAWLRPKYYILIFILGAALFGSAIGGVLDPMALLYRGVVFGLLPALQIIVAKLFSLIGWFGANITGGVLGDIRHTLLPLRPPRFEWSAFFFLTLIAIVASNAWRPRFWCRTLCPTGALLGLAARFSLFGFTVDEKGCTSCANCLGSCQGSSGADDRDKWRPAECMMCFDCADDCPTGAARFRFMPPLENTESSYDLGRRRLAGYGLAGFLTPAFLRGGTSLEAKFSSKLLRPPGSQGEKDFLATCIRCGECIKICPTNGLQPTITEAGFEGLFSPTLVPRIGYCEHTCILCGSVCPTAAIAELDLPTKIGRDNSAPIRLGTAFFDLGRCLPHAFGIDCLVCEEHCPVSPKAIELRREDFVLADGSRRSVLRPYLRPERCIGCGTCEYVCPVVGQAAVRVSNVGESRSVKRGLLLPDTPEKPQADNTAGIPRSERSGPLFGSATSTPVEETEDPGDTER